MKGPVCVESSYAIKVQITDIKKIHPSLGIQCKYMGHITHRAQAQGEKND
jgi:hypothetical protein